MSVVVVALLFGLMAGWIRGGRVGRMEDMGLRWNVVALAGVGFVWASEVGGFAGASPLLLAGSALLISWTLGNLARPGMAVVMIGLLLNLIPVAANDGMPVRPAALVGAGVVSAEELSAGLDVGGGRHLETDADRVTALGDIIPVPFPFIRSAVSFGDLILAMGLAAVIANGMLTRRRRGHVTASAPVTTLRYLTTP